MDGIYQIKIELRDSQPLIWRRILVEPDIAFENLHDIIQLSMGWENDHPYEFVINKVRVYDFGADIDDGEDPTERDSVDTSLDELLTMEKVKFTYLYDFGDSWEHTLVLEKILEKDEARQFPVCTDGERACPPEGCGGMPAYENMLKALADKDYPNHGSAKDWIGENWDAGFFNIKRVNASLLRYANELEEIYEEAGRVVDHLEQDDYDYELEDAEDDESNYESFKHLTCPKDVLADEQEKLDLEAYIEDALRDKDSAEERTLTRLTNQGHDEEKARSLIADCQAIEWFYELKYDIDQINKRYLHNLDQLPEQPLEIPTLEFAVRVLDNCKQGIPFAAIEYLHDDPSEAALSAVINSLKNFSDHQYCWEDCTTAPLWYAFAAEGHLCEDLIDPVIRFYHKNKNSSEWLHEQGQYLIGKLAQKYPDLTTQKVLDAMEKDVEEGKDASFSFLFDVFYFCDINKYKEQILALFTNDDVSWGDALAATIAGLQIGEAMPILKQKLKKLYEKENLAHTIVEIEEAINQLEIGLVYNLNTPLCLQRQATWKEEIADEEEMFYDNDDDWEDEYDPFYFYDTPAPSATPWPGLKGVGPFVKEKKPGRNDPCYCGSGKKYKKCCLDKDNEKITH